MTAALTIGFFLVLVGVVVSAHEAGHLLAALVCRIRVEEIGLGLPPRLVRIGRIGMTSVSLNLLPLGGFVRPAGEFDPAVPDGLWLSPPGRRIGVFVAGALANGLLALVLLTVGFATQWPDRVRVVAVAAGSPAEAAGLRPGDVVLALDGGRVTSNEVLSQALRARAGEAVVLRRDPPTGQGPAGFDTQGELVRYSLPAAVRRAAETIGGMVAGIARGVTALPGGTAGEATVQVVGPLGLKQFSDRALSNAVEWELAYPVLYLGAWLSITVGLVNLLPLPALDGGRAGLALVELLFRKRLPARVERRVHAAGMVLLLLVLLVLTVRDVAARLA